MSEKVKICVHFKKMNKVGYSGQELYECKPRGLVLGEAAKICFVCDLYEEGSEYYDDNIKTEIIDYLNGKRKRKPKKWAKKKKMTTTTKGTKRKRKAKKEEEEEEAESVEETEEEGEGELDEE
ncbi:MAG: hypothetical protein ACTSRA_14180, partial [Promethearchaeota archaeon]